jgi:hypothetical protein
VRSTQMLQSAATLGRRWQSNHTGVVAELFKLSLDGRLDFAQAAGSCCPSASKPTDAFKSALSVFRDQTLLLTRPTARWQTITLYVPASTPLNEKLPSSAGMAFQELLVTTTTPYVSGCT